MVELLIKISFLCNIVLPSRRVWSSVELQFALYLSYVMYGLYYLHRMLLTSLSVAFSLLYEVL